MKRALRRKTKPWTASRSLTGTTGLKGATVQAGAEGQPRPSERRMDVAGKRLGTSNRQASEARTVRIPFGLS